MTTTRDRLVAEPEAGPRMINERHCPFCQASARVPCRHLAVAAEGRDFVRRCVELAHGQAPWERLCRHQRELHRAAGLPEQEDFMWLETAFCDRFLKHLAWFGGMDHEWRSGPRPEQGGFWVLVWSKHPRRLWWELHDELERKSTEFELPRPLSTRPLWPLPG